MTWGPTLPLHHSFPERFMTRTQFLSYYEKLWEIPPGTLKPENRIDELSDWDSLAVLNTIVLMDRELGINVTGAQLVNCRTDSYSRIPAYELSPRRNRPLPSQTGCDQCRSRGPKPGLGRRQDLQENGYPPASRRERGGDRRRLGRASRRAPCRTIRPLPSIRLHANRRHGIPQLLSGRPFGPDPGAAGIADYL